MDKSLNLKAAVGGLICCAVAAAPAAAQNTSNNQLLGGGLKETFNAADISSMMSEFSIQTALAPYAEDETATVIATTEGGARFWISLFQCADPTTGVDCGGAAIFTGLSNAGVSYEDINSFHSDANVTRAVNVSEQNLLIFGTQIFFTGGVGRENFKFVTELFLHDMQTFVDGKAAVGTLVSLGVAPPSGGKVDNIVKADGDAAQPAALPAGYSVDYALAAAISNTWNVRFTPKTD